MPIYGDLDATRACLECLRDEIDRSPELRAILVDDASPDPHIVELARRYAEHRRIRLLSNARNLGFVGAVNRALAVIPTGDVLLLNADALPPRGFAARMAQAARSSPDIGLVMPLSNNGDLASFPRPYIAAPLGSRAEVEAIDRIASEVNRGLVVDIPNGIGFCLYITRACLTAVGGLCEDFDRGYLEDVDLSLRARAKGLRTVCAPSVYVGHAGSKSFGAKKRALVVRNAAIVHARYPGYSLEFAAFAAADPLREARQAIERRRPLRRSGAWLIVAGAGAVGEVARARAKRLAAARAVMFLEVRSRADGWRLILTGSSEDDALAAEFDTSSGTQCEALVASLRVAGVARIEFLDPIAAPPRVVELLQQLNTPYDVVVADAGLLGRRGAGRLCAINRRLPEGAADSDAVARWRGIVARADGFKAIDRRAQAFATRMFPDRVAPEALSHDAAPSEPPQVAAAARRLGLLPIRTGAAEHSFVREIAKALIAHAPQPSARRHRRHAGRRRAYAPPQRPRHRAARRRGAGDLSEDIRARPSVRLRDAALVRAPASGRRLRGIASACLHRLDRRRRHAAPPRFAARPIAAVGAGLSIFWADGWVAGARALD